MIFGFGEYIAILLSLTIGLYYGILAGFGLALMRAWFMFALSSLALAQGRLTDPIRICGAVACVLLCLYPEQWYTPSFILSFITTASLISGGVLLTYVIIAPYILYFFFQLPLQPFLANILAIPWTAFVTIPLLLSHSLLASVESNLLSTPLDYALRVLIWIVKIPGTYTLDVGMQHPLGIVIWTLCIFAVLGFRIYEPLIPGIAAVLLAIYFGPISEPIAMKYGGMYGLWDSKETL